MGCSEKETCQVLVQWQQKCMQLLKSILDPRLQMKLEIISKDSLIW